MSAPDDIPSMSPARKREKSSSSSESISQPSTTPPVEPRPSTSNGHESGHTLGGHRHSELHSSGQLGNHHSRRPSTGHSSTDSRSSTSGGRSSHGERVRRLSSMRDRVLISNANAMARGMSLNELDDTTTTSSSPSPHMNGHDHNNTDDDQQRAGMSNGSRKKKKKKKHWHRTSYDSDLMGWTGLYPNLSAATDRVLDSNPDLESQTPDELRAISRRGLMVYPREAQGSEAAAAAEAAAEPTRNPHPHPQQQPPPPQSLATSPSPMSSPIESSLSPNSELNRNLTPGPETGLVPELEQQEPPTTTSTNLTTTTAINSSNCDATAAATPRVSSLTATIGQDTELDNQAKSVADGAKELQSEEEQKQQDAQPSTSSVSGKRQGSPLENQVKEQKQEHTDEKKSPKEEDHLSPPLSKRQKNETPSPPVRSRSRSKSLNIQDLPPKLEQATSHSKSQESLVIDLHDLPSSETVAKEEPPPSPSPSPPPEPVVNVKSDSPPSTSVAKSETPSTSVAKTESPSPNVMKPETPSPNTVKPELSSPNAVKPDLSSPKVAKPESPFASVAEPEAPSTSVAEPEAPSTSVAEPEAPSTSTAEPEAPSTSTAESEAPSTSTAESEAPSTSAAEPAPQSVGEPAPQSAAEPAPPIEVKPKLPPNNAMSSSTTKRKATDKYYRMPFTYGWRRELVLPSQGNPKRRTGDVFFISPNGRKLRSREDIKPLLKGDLTIDNFCFQRVPQEAGPQHELVRYATPSGNRSKQNEATAQVDPQEPAVTGKRVPKPKVPKGASPPSEGWTSTAAVKGKGRGVLSSNGGNPAAGASVSRKPSKISKTSSSEDYLFWPESEELSEEALLAMQRRPLTMSTINFPDPTDPSTPVIMCEISDESEEDNDDTGSSSSSAMEIAEEVELPGQLPPAHLFDEQKQGQVLEQGHNHVHRPLKDMDVVVIGGRKAVFVRGPPERPPVKLVPRPPDLTSYDRIYRKRIQDKRMGQTLAISLNDAHIGINVLAAVMKTMNMKERVTMSQVCTSWAMVSRDNRVWNRVILRDTAVKSWTKLLTEMARHRTRELDMRGVIMEPNLRFSSELRMLRPLRVLHTDATTNDFLKLVLSCLPRLLELRMTCVSSHLNLGRMDRMRKLRVLRINMTHPKAQILHLDVVNNLAFLTELSIRGVTDLKKLDLRVLRQMRLMQVLALGSCEHLNRERLGRIVLPALAALHTLRIENDHKAMTMFPVDDILRGVAQAGGVRRLELINVDVDSGFGQLLAKCSSVTHLLLAPKCLHNTATMTNAVMQAIRDNADHLLVFRLVLVTQLLSATENLYKGTQKNVIPVQRPVPGIPQGDALNHCSPEDNCQEEDHTQCVAFLPVERLEQILNEMMPMGCLSVAKVAMSETTNMQFLKPGESEST